MNRIGLLSAICGLLISSNGWAQSSEHHQHKGHSKHHTHTEYLGPSSLSATHIHQKGDWMFSYKFMQMEMAGNRDGTSNLSPDQISGVIPNRFFGIAGQPSTYRIVPTQMSMQMHMFGAMYAPSDNLTLMAMANYQDKDMEHLTFAAMAPSNNIGSFKTQSKGIGDTKLSAIYNLYEGHKDQLLSGFGISLPTGSITKSDTILNPMNMSQNIRLPYAMQLGSGTFDLEPSLTYQVKINDGLNIGAQYKAIIRLGRNDEGYNLGDKHNVNLWTEKKLAQATSFTSRLGFETEQSIKGIDTNIIGPVQTADPDNYGGDRVDLGLGINHDFGNGDIQGLHLSIELSVPIYQDLNGPQLERDWGLGMVLRKSF